MDSTSISKGTSDVQSKLIKSIKDNPGLKKGHYKGKARGLAKGHDKVNVNPAQLNKGLTILADEVIKKLNEILSPQLPEGIQSLNVEDHTPEKTAERIFQGVTSLMATFARQNKDLEGEELIKEFMSTIRGGIQEGYGQAMGILGNIGALDFEGVESGIGETMSLLEQKLADFEQQLLGDKNTDDAAENNEAEGEEVTASE